MGKRLTFEQWKELRKIKKQISKDRREKLKAIHKQFFKNLRSAFNILLNVVNVLLALILTTCTGIGSIFVVYYLNKPLGIFYAFGVSYIVAGWTMYLLMDAIFNNKKKVKA